MIRAFIAARVAETPGLRALSARLTRLGGSFRPVPTSALHLTLKFLGDVSKSQAPEIAAIVRRVASQHAGGTWPLSGLGAFPHVDRPGVVWVGLPAATPLIALAAQLEQELEPLGFRREERAWRPHVTVLRVKSRPPAELRALLSELADADFGEARIDAIELFQSELVAAGAKHTSLARAPLVG